MTTISPAARRTRRALAALGVVAASIMVLAPVAGAERRGVAAEPQSESFQEGPSARSSAPSATEPESQSQVLSREGTARSSEDTGRYEHTLCHRTGSAADPYVQITVAFRTADGGVVSSDGGHESHDGPVFDPATMGEGDTWGDIIPPFTTLDGVRYAGKNWSEGQATFDNGCVPVGPTAPADPAEDDGEATPDRAEVPANRGKDARGEELDREDDGVQQDSAEDGATEGAVTSPRRPDALLGRSSAGAGGSADAVEERVLSSGGATGDIASVLGQQVTRDPESGAVVPAADSESTLATGLARTDSGLLVALMLGLSVLIGGYVAVDALRDRVRRTD